jgi:hypothetical protein
MAFFRHYECPDCAGTFRFLHHPADEPPPNFCPLCGSSMTAEPAFVPVAPHIAKTISKTADGVYRQMEQASVANMEAAAELGGGDTSDYAALKITDLPDYLRLGDTAAKMRDNPVAQHMTATGQGGFQGVNGMTGQQLAANTGSGLFPHAGEATRQGLVMGHHTRARVIETAGRIARSK